MIVKTVKNKKMMGDNNMQRTVSVLLLVIAFVASLLLISIETKTQKVDTKVDTIQKIIKSNGNRESI